MSTSIDSTLDYLRRKRVPDNLSVPTNLEKPDDITFTSRTCCFINSRLHLSRSRLQSDVKALVQIPSPGVPITAHVYAPFYERVLLPYRHLISSNQKLLLASITTLLVLSIAIKLLVGSFGHSGFGVPPMYGDFEAQRHWMEITTNLPLSEWYIQTSQNDLQYWGLDYPPVSAFWAYLTGLAAEAWDGDIVALFASRGSENEATRWFMRWTVIVADLIFYIPAVLLLANTICELYDENIHREQVLADEKKVLEDGEGSETRTKTKTKTDSNPVPNDPFSSTRNYIWLTTSLILQPLLLLIDHGHFQYNGITFGLLFLSIKWTLEHRFFLVAVSFPLCCLVKQTGFYFALPLFTYIVSVLLQPIRTDAQYQQFQAQNSQNPQNVPNQQKQAQRETQVQKPSNNQPNPKHPSSRFRLTFGGLFTFISLAIIAVATFAVCFTPFVVSALRDPSVTMAPIIQTGHYPGGSYTYLVEDVDSALVNGNDELVPVWDQLTIFPIHFLTMNSASWNALLYVPDRPYALTPELIIDGTTKTFHLGARMCQIFTTKLLPQILSVFKPTILPIIGRMFPFKRGLFEDKVASIWCISNVVVKWHALFDMKTLTRFSTLATLLLLLPSLIALFFSPVTIPSVNSSGNKSRLTKKEHLLLALAVSGFSFFMASVQTHEKTVMYALLPLCLIGLQYPTLYNAVTLVANTTTMFLLQRDGQFVPFCVVQFSFFLLSLYTSITPKVTIQAVLILTAGLFSVSAWYVKAFVNPPAHLPNLIELAVMAVGLGTFGLTWAFLTLKQLTRLW